MRGRHLVAGLGTRLSRRVGGVLTRTAVLGIRVVIQQASPDHRSYTEAHHHCTSKTPFPPQRRALPENTPLLPPSLVLRVATEPIPPPPAPFRPPPNGSVHRDIPPGPRRARCSSSSSSPVALDFDLRRDRRCGCRSRRVHRVDQGLLGRAQRDPAPLGSDNVPHLGLLVRRRRVDALCLDEGEGRARRYRPPRSTTRSPCHAAYGLELVCQRSCQCLDFGQPAQQRCPRR